MTKAYSAKWPAQLMFYNCLLINMVTSHACPWCSSGVVESSVKFHNYFKNFQMFRNRFIKCYCQQSLDRNQSYEEVWSAVVNNQNSLETYVAIMLSYDIPYHTPNQTFGKFLGCWTSWWGYAWWECTCITVYRYGECVLIL